MSTPFPPIRREPRVEYRPLKPEDDKKAVELVRGAFLFFRAGEPIIHPTHVDVSVFYLNFAIDRAYYDEKTKVLRPKVASSHRSQIGGQYRGSGILMGFLANLIALRIARIGAGHFHCHSIPYFLVALLLSALLIL